MRIVLAFFLLLSLGNYSYSQIKITDDDVADKDMDINPNAMLDLVSSRRGLLLPYVDINVTSTYRRPETGMLFSNKLTNDVYLWHGTGWFIFTKSKFIDTNTALGKITFYDNVFPVRVGIGTDTPTQTLQIDGDGEKATTDDIMNITKTGALVLGTDTEILGASVALVSENEDKGLLLPKIPDATMKKTDISKEGMLVYNDDTKNVHYRDKHNWQPVKGKFGDVSTSPRNHIYYKAINPGNTQMGIGLEIPTQSLHVNGTIKAKSLVIPTNAEKGSVLKYDATKVAIWRPISGIAMEHNSNEGRTEIKYLSNGTAHRSGKKVFVVMDNGNTGIGTDTPNAKLHVADGINIKDKLILERQIKIKGGNPGRSKTFYSMYDVKKSKEETAWREPNILADPDKSRFYIKYISDGKTARTKEKAFVIQDDGRLGLGLGLEVPPTEQLHVKGDVLVSADNLSIPIVPKGITTVNKLNIDNGKKVSDPNKPGDPDNGKFLRTDNSGVGTWEYGPVPPFKARPKDGKEKDGEEDIHIPNLSDRKSLRNLNNFFVIKDVKEEVTVKGQLELVLAGIKVGLKTESPEEQLHVERGTIKTEKGMTSTSNFILKNGNEGDNKLLIVNTNGLGDWETPPFAHNDTDKISYIPNTSSREERTSSEIFAYTNDGKLGMGTKTPKYKIDIRGNIREDLKIGIDEKQVLYFPTNNTGTIALGSGLSKSVGANNTALGMRALSNNISGAYNVAAGYNVLVNQNNAMQNVVVGAKAAFGNTTGAKNVIIGYNTAADLMTGSANTIIGANIGARVAGLIDTEVLESDLSKNIILANGVGKIGFRVNREGVIQVGDGVKPTIGITEKGAFQVSSTTGGFKPPAMKSEQRKKIAKSGTPDMASVGIIVYDLDIGSLLFWDGTDWLHFGARIGMRKIMIKDKNLGSIPPGWKEVPNSRGRYIVNEGKIQLEDVDNKGSKKEIVFEVDESDGASIIDPATDNIKAVSTEPLELKIENMPKHNHIFEPYSHTHNINSDQYKVDYQRSYASTIWSPRAISIGGDWGDKPLDHNEDGAHTHELGEYGGYVDPATGRVMVLPHKHEIKGLDSGIAKSFVSGVLIEYVGVDYNNNP